MPGKFSKKETLAQMFSSKFCEISKNIFFVNRLWVTVSNHTTFPGRTFSLSVNIENRDEVSSSAMQTKRAEKRTKGKSRLLSL